MILRLIGPLLLCFWSISGWCQHEGAHEIDPHVIPWGTIGVEVFNFVFLAGLLVYLLRITVIEHFQGRLRAYTELVERAKNARMEAEQAHRDIASKLEQLQGSADESIKRAQSESLDLKNKMIAEAKSVARRMEEEAQRTIIVEIENARGELRDDLLHKAIESARESLKKTIGSSEQIRLQSEFADKIQVVG
jgi:F-type H+-transporting ATPase subunit b